jgi:hypothetical protein
MNGDGSSSVIDGFSPSSLTTNIQATGNITIRQTRTISRDFVLFLLVFNGLRSTFLVFLNE